jgi:lipopolysaccharide/colanic/teichoic acid biosynthesis glycosyltransferase
VLKRTFDVVVAGTGLIVLLPVFVLVAIAVKLTSAGPVFFKQERMGKGFRPFSIYKFRTMAAGAPKQGGPITVGDDPRITRVGRFLRKTNLDELPQLVNVLKGDMSLVGPRPEVPRYVEMFRGDYEEILGVRPGITDVASIEFRDEAAILGAAADPEREYVERILPEKIRLAKQYIARQSLCFDCRLILTTIWRVAADRLRFSSAGPRLTQHRKSDSQSAHRVSGSQAGAWEPEGIGGDEESQT